jgi:hypothetical protein
MLRVALVHMDAHAGCVRGTALTVQPDAMDIQSCLTC